MAISSNIGKKFSLDLSNYTEIKRGLTPQMRKLIPSKKEVERMSADLQKQLIDALNTYRDAGYKKKRGRYDLPSAEEQQLEDVLLSSKGDRNHPAKEELTAEQRGILATALLNLKSTTYEESLERVATTVPMVTRNRDWYSAQTEIELGQFDIDTLIREADINQLRLIYESYENGDLALDEADAKKLEDYLSKRQETISTVAQETLAFAEDLNRKIANMPKGFSLDIGDSVKAEAEERRAYAKRKRARELKQKQGE